MIVAVTEGKTPFNYRYGEDFWSYLKKNEEEVLFFIRNFYIKAKYFHGGMDDLAIMNNRVAVEDFPEWSQFRILCDVVYFSPLLNDIKGGGTGRLISAILKSNPSIEKGVIFDLPEVIELAKIRFAKEEPENITQRVNFVTGSFFKDTIPMVEDIRSSSKVKVRWNYSKANIA